LAGAKTVQHQSGAEAVALFEVALDAFRQMKVKSEKNFMHSTL
jgi:hypothetical protein